jgi:hypothetical protein
LNLPKDNVNYGVNPLIISALWACPPPSRPPVRDKIGSKKDLWSEQIPKIAKRFLGFARSSLVLGGEAAELQPEFTLKIRLLSVAKFYGQPQTTSNNYLQAFSISLR